MCSSDWQRLDLSTHTAGENEADLVSLLKAKAHLNQWMLRAFVFWNFQRCKIQTLTFTVLAEERTLLFSSSQTLSAASAQRDVRLPYHTVNLIHAEIINDSLRLNDSQSRLFSGFCVFRYYSLLDAFISNTKPNWQKISLWRLNYRRRWSENVLLITDNYWLIRRHAAK